MIHQYGLLINNVILHNFQGITILWPKMGFNLVVSLLQTGKLLKPEPLQAGKEEKQQWVTVPWYTSFCKCKCLYSYRPCYQSIHTEQEAAVLSSVSQGWQPSRQQQLCLDNMAIDGKGQTRLWFARNKTYMAEGNPSLVIPCFCWVKASLLVLAHHCPFGIVSLA